MKSVFRKFYGILACLTVSACLLSGCAGLLERSYSVLEPYADRYWDSSAEDTLRAESYQDLVNSMLLLIEQHAEEGVIRCYGEVGEYPKALAARSEVQRETKLGSYLLKNFQLSFEEGVNYNTLTCKIIYRDDAEDVDSLMTLSDTQSLVDLLRLAVREEHEKLTALFAYDTPREDVIAAVESFWQELCRSEMEENAVPDSENLPALEDDGNLMAVGETPPETAGDPAPDAEEPEDVPEDVLEVPDEALPLAQEDPPVVYPPCPWEIRFYPDQDTAEIVEVLLED